MLERFQDGLPVCSFVQGLQACLQVLFIQWLDMGHEDFLVFGTGCTFFAGQEFFVELFAGAEAGVGYLDVLAWS